MQTILIANPKGGSGKTTLATNIAGWLAGKRQRVALADADPQQSANQWLARRPPLFPPIAKFGDDTATKGAKDAAPQWLVFDSAAGLHSDTLRESMKRADVMLVPISPSAFDLVATDRFLRTIAEYPSVKQGRVALALVGMRVDARTRAAAELDEYLKDVNFPVPTHLRDTQIYVHCARDGLSVFDLPRSRAEADWEQWKPLTRWIARQATTGRSR